MSQYRSKLVLSVIVVCTLGLTAFAADYERITGSFSFTDDFFCADQFLVEGSYDEVMHTYYAKFGKAIRIAFTGDVRITFTNLVNGMSYRPNTSGPGTVDLSTGQSIVAGVMERCLTPRASSSRQMAALSSMKTAKSSR
jgi:hypothetical protein